MVRAGSGGCRDNNGVHVPQPYMTVTMPQSQLQLQLRLHLHLHPCRSRSRRCIACEGSREHNTQTAARTDTSLVQRETRLLAYVCGICASVANCRTQYMDQGGRGFNFFFFFFSVFPENMSFFFCYFFGAVDPLVYHCGMNSVL